MLFTNITYEEYSRVGMLTTEFVYHAKMFPLARRFGVAESFQNCKNHSQGVIS